mmetsp:Transcript_110927/g.312727  ORF Transcript_110927/g.312727 Transcript_110927/m.312727 type:complete len:545 (-) Transcript_110927:141-1775(-)
MPVFALSDERTYLILVGIVASMYSYGPLMTFPLYLALTAAKGEETVSASVAGTILMAAKLVTFAVHAVGVRFGGELRQMQAMICLMYSVSMLALTAAANTSVTGVKVLVGVSSLNLVSSRVIAGTLFTVPSEERMLRRTYVHDASIQAGCLWTALVAFLLQHEAARNSWLIRAIVLNLPLVVTFAAWLLIQPASFFSSARMREAEREQPSNLSLTPVLPGNPEAPAKGNADEHQRCANMPEEKFVGASKAVGPGLAGPAGRPPRLPVIFATERLRGFTRSFSRRSDSRNDLKVAWEEKRPWVWGNARFRVLAVTSLLSWWSFAFYAYNVFPSLMTRTGPPLQVVSALYTAEGITYAVVVGFILPWLQKDLFAKFFGSVSLLLVLPVLAIGIFGQIHWTAYLLILLLTDISCATNNALLGVVLLRCLPWNHVGPFYSQVSAVGGWLCALSFMQLSLHQCLGSWTWTAVVGHRVPSLVAFCVYLFHWRAVSEIWDLLKVPVHSNSDCAAEEIPVPPSPAKAEEKTASRPLATVVPSLPGAVAENDA